MNVKKKKEGENMEWQNPSFFLIYDVTIFFYRRLIFVLSVEFLGKDLIVKEIVWS
jgi:hypothetical protein